MVVPKQQSTQVYQKSETLGSSYESDLIRQKSNEYLQDLGRMVTSVPELERLCKALDKDAGSQYDIANVGLGIVTLLLRKNADYGDTAGRSPVLAPNLSAQEAILVRMSDKIARLSNLLQKKDGEAYKAEVDESIADNMSDLAGYAILWLVANNKDKPNALA